ILMSIAGGILAKREGLAVWTRFRATLARGEVPSTELIDGVLVLFGAALLLTPGFLTDVLGLVLLVPVSRAAVRRAVMKSGGWLVAKRFPFLIPLGIVRNRSRKVNARTVVVEPVEPPDGPPQDPNDRDRIAGS
ncbi:MAG: FxsA family protein, partial [Actinomycetota bacterium]